MNAKSFLIFNNNTGEILRTYVGSDNSLQMNVSDGEDYIEAGSRTISSQRFRVDLSTRTIVERVQSEEEALADLLRESRITRDSLLAGSDWTQSPDNRLTPEQRTAWAEVREQWRQVVDDIKAGLDPRPWAEAPQI